MTIFPRWLTWFTGPIRIAGTTRNARKRNWVGRCLLLGHAMILMFLALCISQKHARGEFVYLNSWGTAGNLDGQFSSPNGVAVGPAGDVYVADSGNHRIQRFSSSGDYLSQFGISGSGNGEFSYPRQLDVSASGDVYVVDQGNHRIQRFDNANNFVSKFGANGTGIGEFDLPHDIAVTSTGDVYVADFNNSRIQKFDNSNGFLSQFGTNGNGDGEFNFPFGIADSPTGEIYVVDSNTHRVQKFDTANNFLIKYGTFGSGDGQFQAPHGVAVGASGDVFVADTSNHRIQQFDSSGNYLDQLGSAGSGTGEFNAPNGVAVTSTGLVYVADSGNNRVQQFFDTQAWVSGPYPISTNLRLDTDEMYGDTFQVDAFRTNLQVDGTLSIAFNSTLKLNGGILSADLILVEAGGTMELLAPFTNSSPVNLVDPSSRIQGETFTNQALMYGQGRIAAPWVNESQGEVRASENDRIVFAAAGNSNAGKINVLKGTVEFEDGLTNTGEINLLDGTLIVDQTLTNGLDGFISGRGSIFANSGLTNSAVLAFSGGLTDLFGDVDNQGGSQIVTSGGGTTTFYDDVVHNGVEIRTSAGSSSVFFGAVSGGSPFTGTGTTFFEGDLRPGNSPGGVHFEGDVVLGHQANTQIELGGQSAGTDFDQLRVSGAISLDGRLEVNLYQDFQLGPSQQFTIVEVEGELAGEFQDLGEGALVGNYGEDLFITYSGGDGNDVALFTLSQPGDFNGDQIVDGADLLNWQTGFGIPTGAMEHQGDGDLDGDVDGFDFLSWQQGYSQMGHGQSPGSLRSVQQAVPEPSALILLLLAMSGLVSLTTR